MKSRVFTFFYTTQKFDALLIFSWMELECMWTITSKPNFDAPEAIAIKPETFKTRTFPQMP